MLLLHNDGSHRHFWKQVQQILWLSASIDFYKWLWNRTHW